MTSLVERLQPTRQDVVDIAAALVLTMLGVVGFRTAFAGNQYLLVGLGGAIFGAGLGFVVSRLRWPPLTVAAVVVAVFFIVGGAVAVRDDAIAGALPSLAVVRDLTDGIVNGWARLLTTVPPSTTAGNVLAVPYLCGFLGAFFAVLLALRVRRWPVCVLPAVIVLGLSLLLGTEHPAALLLQGAIFGMGAVAWMAARQSRARNYVVHTGRANRVVSAVGLLAVAAVGASVLGPHMPMAHANDRYVLRKQFLPPFDPRQYPSPLAGYRNYEAKDTADSVELTVEGLPAQTPIRLAVMDDYDGSVWAVSGSGNRATGVFKPVGETFPIASAGPRSTTTFDVGALATIWVPTVGVIGGLTFQGPRAGALQDSFRYNSEASAGAAPLALAKEDQYVVSVASAPAATDALKDVPVDPTAALPLPPGVPPAVKSIAADIIAGKQTAYERVQVLEAHFQQGYYSDGGKDDAGNDTGVAPGHSLARLVNFLSADKPIGDGEQYAAAMALLVRSLGLPVRVVMGFRPAASGKGPVAVHAKDVDAWVEVAFQGVGWVAFFPTPDHSRKPPQQTTPQPKKEEIQQAPPPSTLPPPNTIPPRDPTELADAKQPKTAKTGSGFAVPAWVPYVGTGVGVPLALAGGAAFLIVSLKRRRRRSRREAPTGAARIAGGWLEVLDLARDLGKPVPAKATRRETARFLQADGVGVLATQADDAIFGADDPDHLVAAEFWQHVEATRHTMVADLRRADRVKAAVSLTSLRTSR